MGGWSVNGYLRRKKKNFIDLNQEGVNIIIVVVVILEATAESAVVVTVIIVTVVV